MGFSFAADKKRGLLRLGSAWLIRLSLGGVFIFSGVVKLADPVSFGETIAKYELLPEMLIGLFAYGLPMLEVAVGLGLILGLPGALSLLTGLLVLFSGVLWFGILKDLQVDCGCFSAGELAGKANLEQALVRDLIMLAGAGLLFVLDPKRPLKNTARNY